MRENEHLIDDLVLALLAGSSGCATCDLGLYRIDGNARHIPCRYGVLRPKRTQMQDNERGDDERDDNAQGEAAIIGRLIDLGEMKSKPSKGGCQTSQSRCACIL